MIDDPAGQPPKPLGPVISLTDAEREALGEEFGRLARSLHSLPLDDEGFLTEAELAGIRLPRRLLQELRRFRRHGNSTGALFIRNVPVDPVLPATPLGGRLESWGELPVATVTQLAVTSQIGDVIAYADEKNGALIQDVVPVEGAEKLQENSGTVYLELHTENGFHPHKPDFVTLVCLRPDHARTSYTLVGAAAEVLPALSGHCVEVLRKPSYRVRASSSFGAGKEGLRAGPVAVLSGPAHSPEFLADFHAMEPLTDEAMTAFSELKKALLATIRGARLAAGDLLVIDNRAAVHGRTSFVARYDATDRWLRRCFAVSDIRRSRGARPAGSRVCAPLATIGLAAFPGDLPGPGIGDRVEGAACSNS
jgi:L-asparagine oxygenase